MKAVVVIFALLCAAVLIAYIMAAIKEKEDESSDEHGMDSEHDCR